jgi:hypothetical protein
MNNALKLLVAVVVFGFSSMVAQAQDKAAALVLPVTDRMVIETCYAKVLEKTSRGITVVAVAKKDVSPLTQEYTEKYVAEFSEKMGKEGFKDVVVVPDRCMNKDDTAGGVTVVFRFYVLSDPDRPDQDQISPNAFVKVPNASLLPIVQKSGSGSGAEKLAALSAAMSKIIRNAQARAQPDPTAAAATVESRN